MQEEFTFLDFEVDLDEEEIVDTPEEETSEEPIEKEEEKEEVSDEIETDDDAIGVYKTLVDKGIVSESEDFKGTWEEIDSMMDSLPEKAMDAVIESMPDTAKSLVEFALNKPNVTLEDLKEFVSLVEKDQEVSLVIDNLDKAKDLIRKEYGSSFDEDVIESMLDTLEDKGEDYVIKKAKELQTKKELQAEKLLEATKSEKVAMLEQQKKFTQTLNTELSNLNYKPSRVQAIRQNLNPQVIARKNEMIRQSPKAILALADIYSYFNEETKEFDLSALSKETESKAASRIKDKMIRDNFNSSKGKGTAKSKKQNDFSFEDLEPIFD